MKQLALQLYRMAVVVAVVWLIRDLAVRQRTHGDSPIRVDEVKSFVPEAASLRPDTSERDGLFILNRAGRELGYVVRTQPQCRDIIGYCGVTDALVVLYVPASLPHTSGERALALTRERLAEYAGGVEGECRFS